MTIQEVLREIDEHGGTFPFMLTIVKADGTLRDIVAYKRNHQRMRTGQAQEGTNFKYSLKQKGVLLLNELQGVTLDAVVIGANTHRKVKGDLSALQHHSVGREAKLAPKSIKIFSIQSYNRNPVTHE